MPLPVAIALAGALGALARWGVTAGVQRTLPGVFPSGTLFVNVFGCFLFGLLAPLLADRAHLPLALRTALLTGFLGAFTTFSAFSFDTVELLRSGHGLKAGLNVALSVGLTLVAVALGLRLAQRWI